MKNKTTKEIETRGGARSGAGRKSAEELGKEKKVRCPAYLYPSKYQELLKYFPSVSAAAEWAVELKKSLETKGKTTRKKKGI